MESPTREIVTFLGCPVSARTSELLQRWRLAAALHLALPAGDPVLRWTRPESLHVTLHYFGVTAQTAIADHQSALGAIVQATREIPVCLKEITLFPQHRQARGLWVEVEDPTGALYELHSNLVRKLQQLGLSVDRRRFRPHITLGRIPSRLRGSLCREAAEILQQFATTQSLDMTADTIAQVHWYQSVQQPGGNLYRPLVTWPLTAS